MMGALAPALPALRRKQSMENCAMVRTQYEDIEFHRAQQFLAPLRPCMPQVLPQASRDLLQRGQPDKNITYQTM